MFQTTNQSSVKSWLAPTNSGHNLVVNELLMIPACAGSCGQRAFWKARCEMFGWLQMLLGYDVAWFLGNWHIKLGPSKKMAAATVSMLFWQFVKCKPWAISETAALWSSWTMATMALGQMAEASIEVYQSILGIFAPHNSCIWQISGWWFSFNPSEKD